jgi:hypothetical protein
MVGEVLRGALLAVDDHQHAVDDRAGLPERLGGVDGALAGRRDILDDDDLLALVEFPLDEVSRPVLLLLLARDDVGQPRLDARDRDQRDAAQRDAAQLRLADPLGERLGDERQTAGVRLEDVLVHVVVRGTTV